MAQTFHGATAASLVKKVCSVNWWRNAGLNLSQEENGHIDVCIMQGLTLHVCMFGASPLVTHRCLHAKLKRHIGACSPIKIIHSPVVYIVLQNPTTLAWTVRIESTSRVWRCIVQRKRLKRVLVRGRSGPYIVMTTLF